MLFVLLDEVFQCGLLEGSLSRNDVDVIAGRCSGHLVLHLQVVLDAL